NGCERAFEKSPLEGGQGGVVRHDNEVKSTFKKRRKAAHDFKDDLCPQKHPPNLLKGGNYRVLGFLKCVVSE
ncbi:MAG: hypothetical protein AAB354_02275, partial [candidate division KSB1 bacterium]